MSRISSGSGEWWVIFVGNGYGSFFFRGTEKAAEQMRKHKARWEQAVARKRRATDGELGLNVAMTESDRRRENS